MEIIRNTVFTAAPGPADRFVGQVWVERMVEQEDTITAFYRVTFTPGARTNWHTHPAGQILYITSGNGRVQVRGGAVQPVSMGDVVVFAADEEHWHGAALDCPMQHIAVQTRTEAGYTLWLGPVTDEEYGGVG